MDLKPVSNHTRIRRYYLAASQTIEPGDPVVLNASGLVELADASSAALLGICAEKVTSSTAADPVGVFDDPHLEFQIAADTANQAVRTEVGDTCDLVVASTVFKANLDATSTNVLLVTAVNVDFDPLLDGTAITGSSLAGNFTPPWNNTALIRCKFKAHQLAN